MVLITLTGWSGRLVSSSLYSGLLKKAINSLPLLTEIHFLVFQSVANWSYSPTSGSIWSQLRLMLIVLVKLRTEYSLTMVSICNAQSDRVLYWGLPALVVVALRLFLVMGDRRWDTFVTTPLRLVTMFFALIRLLMSFGSLVEDLSSPVSS